MISVPAAFGCRMVQKVSKMSKMTHFTQFSHFFGHYAKHRCYFDFHSMISVPAVFGCQMVPAFQKYQIFCHTTSFRWCDIYFSPKNPKGGPFGKKIFFVMKPNNMGIKSCVLMPLNTSWRDKIKILSVFCARAQKVSKMFKIPHFTHFWHFFGHYAKHRWYFDFYSSGYF